MRDISVNAGLCSGLCLNLFYYSETAVGHLNGRMPDRYQVEDPYASYARLLLVQLPVHLDDFRLFPA
jgi:hypothetical protein